jgi:hypothetical protein
VFTVYQIPLQLLSFLSIPGHLGLCSLHQCNAASLATSVCVLHILISVLFYYK